jgi:VanZ family protein
MSPRRSQQIIWRYGPAIVMSAVIPWLSLAPAWLFSRVEKTLPPLPAFDKIAHAVLYAALTAACLHALPQDKRLHLRSHLRVVLAASLYGAALELGQQGLTRTRAMDPRDALANAAGSLICALALYVWRRRQAVAERPET